MYILRNNNLACSNLKISFFQDRGYDYLVKGCEESYGKSCLLAGMFHKTKFDPPIKTPRDLAKSTEFFGRACDLDLARGCFNHGSNLRIGSENVKVSVIFKIPVYRKKFAKPRKANTFYVICKKSVIVEP